MKVELRKRYLFYALFIIPFLAAGLLIPRGITGRKVKIVFAGDIMMDRYFRTRAEYSPDDENPYGFILPLPLPSLADADFIIANLEAPVSTNPSLSRGTAYGSRENFLLRMEPAALELLRRNGIAILNTGNNHMGAFGKEEREETYRYLEKYGLRWFGDNGKDEGKNYLLLEKGGIRLCFINYNQFTQGGEETALETLKEKVHRSDIQIMYCHWGEEYRTEPSVRQRTLAKTFIEAGADLVVGSHPHVIQPREIIGGVPVYYSLGNFIFDQYFSPETRRGLLLEAEFGVRGRRVKYRESFVSLKPDGTTVEEEPQKNAP